ncbi:hypothetical protein RJD24_18665 [Bacillaceae bacterium IKA-2]|nr:hypothetical protein RJD24_18665 [Bacillaceae bacterium IKA-2]
MGESFLIIVYIDQILKGLAFIWFILMIIVSLKELKNERRRKVLFDRIEADSAGIEKILGKPWKEARKLLKDD